MAKLIRGATSINFALNGETYCLSGSIGEIYKCPSDDIMEQYFNKDCYFCRVKLNEERNSFLKLGAEIADFVNERFCNKCWEKIKLMDDKKILSMIAMKKIKGEI